MQIHVNPSDELPIYRQIVRQFTGQPGIFHSRIAFVSQVGRGKEIFVMDYDGDRIKKLTGNGSLNLNPAYVASHWESVEVGAARSGDRLDGVRRGGPSTRDARRGAPRPRMRG